MVASTSMVISDHQFHTPFHFVSREVIYLCLGIVAMVLTVLVPMVRWQAMAPWALLLGLACLVVVLLPGLAHTVNGSRRWLALPFFTIQASEIMMLSLVLFLASYATKHAERLRTQSLALLPPLAVCGLTTLLLLLEPNFGSAAIAMLMTLSVLFLAQAPRRAFILLSLAVACLVVALVLWSPYRLTRLMAFMHPWRDAFGSGYQLTQSLIAFGRGGLFGVGLGNGLQKLYYLPEAHTDFIYAVIAEEFGLFGAVVVLFLLALFIVRALHLGDRCRQQGALFSAYICFAIGTWFAYQVTINLGVNMGLLPTKGLTLPFVSYGGSSLLVSCIAAGLLMRVAYELSQRPIKRCS